MPPKPKYTKDEIVSAAYGIARERGIDAVVARDVGNRLGASVSPIFTVFSSMTELKAEVRKRALAEFSERTQDAQNYTPAFKQFGKLMVEFAKNEPNLFKLLFMQDGGAGRLEDVFRDMGDVHKLNIGIIERDYGLEHSYAGLLFNQLWVYCYGICVMCANRVCDFSDAELDEMLGREFQANMLLIKEGKAEMKPVAPRRLLGGRQRKTN